MIYEDPKVQEMVRNHDIGQYYVVLGDETEIELDVTERFITARIKEPDFPPLRIDDVDIVSCRYHRPIEFKVTHLFGRPQKNLTYKSKAAVAYIGCQG